MKKNDVFTFTAPNGVEVQAITIKCLFLREDMTESVEKWLCYAQNRLVIVVQKVVYTQHPNIVSLLKFMRKEHELTTETKIYLQDILVDYAVLPEYDNMLELHQAMDYPICEQNMEKPDPDEGEDIFWDSCAEEHNKQEDV